MTKTLKRLAGLLLAAMMVMSFLPALAEGEEPIVITVGGRNEYGTDVNEYLYMKYLEEKFYASDVGKTSVLLQKYSAELFVLVYLGRADASLTAAKRNIICEYLNGIGAATSEDIVARACRRIKIDTAEFKKIVDKFSKVIPEDRKKAFVDAAELVVGGRSKAKPFGLAGLQYIESKIKI